MAGPDPTREVTEKTVRGFEKKLGLEVGTMDIPIDEFAENPPVSAEKLIKLLVNATRAVGRVWEAETVNVSIGKFADIVILTFEDSIEHGGVLREDRIKQSLDDLNDPRRAWLDIVDESKLTVMARDKSLSRPTRN